jgi:dolichyl-diphosphooligosaccharide--protein glycosyltransferase
MWQSVDVGSRGAAGGTGRSPRWIRIIAPILLFLLAVVIRGLPYNGVFIAGGVQFFGNDAYYHMRRALYSLEHFPAVLDFDHYINFPIGARPIWTPFFDSFLALLLLPLRGRPIHQLETVAVWVPPLLGGATVLALYWIAKRHFGQSA